MRQLRNLASLPFVFKHMAAMPDVHWGMGQHGRALVHRPRQGQPGSHGAGRAMGRNEAMRRFTVEDHAWATAGVECCKDAAVIDETPMACKDIDAVMAAQADLVDIVHTLKQMVCVKG